MREFLRKIYVIQSKDIKDVFNRNRTKSRLNPFNPITYIVVVLVLIVGFFVFGVIGIKDNMDKVNPFKYN